MPFHWQCLTHKYTFCVWPKMIHTLGVCISIGTVCICGQKVPQDSYHSPWKKGTLKTMIKKGAFTLTDSAFQVVLECLEWWQHFYPLMSPSNLAYKWTLLRPPLEMVPIQLVCGLFCGLLDLCLVKTKWSQFTSHFTLWLKNLRFAFHTWLRFSVTSQVKKKKIKQAVLGHTVTRV